MSITIELWIKNTWEILGELNLIIIEDLGQFKGLHNITRWYSLFKCDLTRSLTLII